MASCQEDLNEHLHQQQPQQYEGTELYTRNRQPLPNHNHSTNCAGEVATVKSETHGQRQSQQRVADSSTLPLTTSPELMVIRDLVKSHAVPMPLALHTHDRNSGSSTHTRKPMLLDSKKQRNPTAILRNINLNNNYRASSRKETGLHTASRLDVVHTPLYHLAPDGTWQRLQSQRECIWVQRVQVGNDDPVVHPIPHLTTIHSPKSRHDDTENANHNRVPNTSVDTGVYPLASRASSANGANSLYNLRLFQHHQRNHRGTSSPPDSKSKTITTKTSAPSDSTPPETLSQPHQKPHQHKQQ